MSEKNEWKPIASAPKDGTGILGYWDVGGIHDCNFRAVKFHRGAWWETNEDYKVREPTHWMPLPAAPGSIPSAPGDAQDDETQAILRWIMRTAESAKEDCGMDPETPAAIRNGKLASIASAAAQALGLKGGPSYQAPAAGDAQLLTRALDLLERNKPFYGQIGSRDMDVAACLKDWDEVTTAMRAALAAQVPHNGGAA